MPVNFYQIQTKFRDEIRPRFGVMRSREFIMKDAYSFDIDEDGLEVAYQKMHAAYTAIFERLGLKFRVVWADSGDIGGSKSQEFHVLADSGEDAIAYSDEDDYASNVETAATNPTGAERPSATQRLEKIATPGVSTIEDLCDLLGITADQTVKTLIVEGTDGPVAVVLRGDHELNAVKAQKVAGSLTADHGRPCGHSQSDRQRAGFPGPRGSRHAHCLRSRGRWSGGFQLRRE